MNITSVIDHTVSLIHSGEERKKAVSYRLAPLKKATFSSVSRAMPEKALVFPVKKWVAQGLVAGVDSGFVAKRLASVDIVLIRAMGVVFDYKDGKVGATKYVPDFFHFPEPFLAGNSLEEDEAEQSKSLMRLNEEVNVAKKIIREHKPKYLFIDGSIVPQYQDKPRKESKLNENYSGIIKEFESLYELAEQNGTTLIATVEDSRGSRFRSALQEDVIPAEKTIPSSELDGLFDSQLLDYFLSLGERSCAFSYTKDVAKHPILQDFSPEWGNSIYGMYLKPTLFDRPLRVEFICKDCMGGKITQRADEVAGVAYALSSLHREYAYPSVLIDADMHAKLSQGEIDIVFNKILDKLGNSMRLRMRRENRPF